MKRSAVMVFVVLAVLAVMAMFGTAGAAFAAGPVTLTDDAGNTVTLHPIEGVEDMLYYHSDRFGFSVKIPHFFTKAVTLPGRHEEMVLESEDGKMFLSLFGSEVFVEEWLEESYDSVISEIGIENIISSFKFDNYWEIDWEKDGTRSRRKLVVKNDEVWCSLEISVQKPERFYEALHEAIYNLSFGEG